jgi:hypothetical protein
LGTLAPLRGRARQPAAEFPARGRGDARGHRPRPAGHAAGDLRLHRVRSVADRGSSNAYSTGRRVPSPGSPAGRATHTLNEITPVKTTSDREGQVADANSGEVRSMKLISVVLA